MTGLRGTVKHAVELVLVAGGPATIARHSRTRDVLILGYHNIAPAGERPCGDRSLHLPQAAFAAQLDALLDTHDVVPLDALLGTRAEGAAATRPRAAITFDDAYVGLRGGPATHLRPVLRRGGFARRDIPATVFVAPDFIGGRSFWWDALADAEAGLAPETRERALVEARGIDACVRTMIRTSAAELPEWARCATEHDFDAALATSRITLASHTWSHPNLTQLTDAELATELARPREWLARYGDRALPVISYPYGLADARVQRAAREAGYRAGFMITGGWTSPPIGERYDVPRLNIPAGLSRDGFVLRAAGILAN